MARIVPRLVSTAFLFAFAAAEAAPVTFDFENLPIATETPFTIESSGLSATFAGPPDVDPGAFGISSNFLTSTGFRYRLMNGDFLTIGSAFGASGSVLTVAFSAPVTGLTFDFALDDTADRSTLTTVAGGIARTASPALTAGFAYPEATFSFVSSPFTTVTFASTAIDFQLDNLRATVAQVPEPATGALLASGLGALVVRRRRAVPARAR